MSSNLPPPRPNRTSCLPGFLINWLASLSMYSLSYFIAHTINLFSVRFIKDEADMIMLFLVVLRTLCSNFDKRRSFYLRLGTILFPSEFAVLQIIFYKGIRLNGFLSIKGVTSYAILSVPARDRPQILPYKLKEMTDKN